MRDTYATRKMLIDSAHRRDLAVATLIHAPLGVEVVIREPEKPRKPDQNSLMWAGPLRDIADQAWVQGRRYPAETWHEHFKREFMPEDDDPELERLVTDHASYRKWDYDPMTGERVCIASTKRLKVRGMALYLEQLHAAGAELGVMFHVKGNGI